MQFTDHALHQRPGVDAGEPALALKTPTLLGSAATASYFHDGSLATVADVVGWYDRRYRLELDPGAAEDLAELGTSLLILGLVRSIWGKRHRHGKTIHSPGALKVDIEDIS